MGGRVYGGVCVCQLAVGDGKINSILGSFHARDKD